MAIKYSNAKSGPKFIGPIELVNYYQIDSKNLCCQPTTPCNRAPNIQPINYLFINNNEFYILVNTEIRKQFQNNSNEKRDALGKFRYKYEKIVLRNLHQKQQWYRKDVDRDEAESNLKESGLVDGKFLVRGDDTNGFRISLCFDNNIIHYKIYSYYSNTEEKMKYSLDSNATLFDTIIHLIGMLCSHMTTICLNAFI